MAKRSPANRSTTTLYRYFGAEHELLYVGISKHPLHRLGEHRVDKAWWLKIESVSLTHYSTRAEALAAEQAAIVAERPLHNIVHNGPRPLAPWQRAVQLDERIMILYEVACLMGPAVKGAARPASPLVRPGACWFGYADPAGFVPFCANHYWYGSDMPLRSVVSHLVGWGAEDSADPWLHTSEAYDAVYDAAYQMLSDCDHGDTDCGMFSSDDTSIRALLCAYDGGLQLAVAIDRAEGRG